MRAKRSKSSSFVFGERPVLVDGPGGQPRQLPRVSSCESGRELTVCGLVLGSMGLANNAASLVSDWPLVFAHITSTRRDVIVYKALMLRYAKAMVSFLFVYLLRVVTGGSLEGTGWEGNVDATAKRIG